MLYIVKVYADGEVYEYEYGLLEHAQEHMHMERYRAELYFWLNLIEITQIVSINVI